MRALRAGYPDLVVDCHLPPRPMRRSLGKVLWEQLQWPWRARGALRHVPYLAPPVMFPGTVVTAHDVISFALTAYAAGATQTVYRELVRLGLRNARTVIVDSESTRRDLVGIVGVQQKRIRVIPLGVDARFRPASTVEREAMRQRLGLPGRFGLYLGSWDVRKNLGVVLDAWPAVWQACGLPLVIAGRAPRRGSRVYADWFSGLDATADSWLHVIGPVEERDKPDLYAAAEIFVFPSRYEGFGLDPLEAMASGVPVVVADTTSLPEVVGDAGCLVSPDKPQRWTEAVQRIVSDSGLASSMRERGLARASEFTWAKTAELTHAVYAAATE